MLGSVPRTSTASETVVTSALKILRVIAAPLYAMRLRVLLPERNDNTCLNNVVPVWAARIKSALISMAVTRDFGTFMRRLICALPVR